MPVLSSPSKSPSLRSSPPTSPSAPPLTRSRISTLFGAMEYNSTPMPVLYLYRTLSSPSKSSSLRSPSPTSPSALDRGVACLSQTVHSSWHLHHLVPTWPRCWWMGPREVVVGYSCWCTMFDSLVVDRLCGVSRDASSLSKRGSEKSSQTRSELHDEYRIMMYRIY